MRKEFLSPEIISGVIKLIDFIAIMLIGAAAHMIYLAGYLENPNYSSYEFIGRYLITSAFGAFLFLIIYQRMGGYNFDRLARLSWQLPRLALAWFGCFSILLILAFVAKVSETYSRGWTISWIIGVAVFLMISRIIIDLAIARWTYQGHFFRNIVVVGAGEVGKRFIEKIQHNKDSGARIIGVFDDRKSRLAPLEPGINVLGNTDNLVEFARKNPVDEIIVALPLSDGEGLRTLFEKLKSLPVDLRLSIEPLAEMFSVNGIGEIVDIPLLQIADRPLKQLNGIIKKCEDVILTSLLLAMFAPAMALIALIIKISSPGPVFFVQDRFGFNNKAIRVLKFRTMYWDKVDPSGAQRTMRNDPRVTRFGRFMRSFSLDELPQLINVLRGEMSLVGPRPHAIAMKAGDRLYHEAVDIYFHRHKVKPGITGWAQVNGLRGEIDSLDKARQRVTYDLEYIERWSIWLDLRSC